MHAIPEGLVDDPLMLARIGYAFVDGLAQVNAIVENPVDVALVDWFAPLRRYPFRTQADDELCHRAAADEALEQRSHCRGLDLVDQELAVLDVVARRGPATHPYALLARGGKLVANAPADRVALEMCKAEQDIQGQPAHGCRRIERLGHAHEGDVVAVKDLDQLGEIHQGTG